MHLNSAILRQRLAVRVIVRVLVLVRHRVAGQPHRQGRPEVRDRGGGARGPRATVRRRRSHGQAPAAHPRPAAAQPRATPRRRPQPRPPGHGVMPRRRQRRCAPAQRPRSLERRR